MLKGLRLNCWLPGAIMLALAMVISAWLWRSHHDLAEQALGHERQQALTQAIALLPDHDLQVLWQHAPATMIGLAWIDLNDAGDELLIKQVHGDFIWDELEPAKQLYSALNEAHSWQDDGLSWIAVPWQDEAGSMRGCVAAIWQPVNLAAFPWWPLLDCSLLAYC